MEEILLGSFEREKSAMSERFQQEITSLRKVVEDECESKYSLSELFYCRALKSSKKVLIF